MQIASVYSLFQKRIYLYLVLFTVKYVSWGNGGGGGGGIGGRFEKNFLQSLYSKKNNLDKT